LISPLDSRKLARLAFVALLCVPLQAQNSDAVRSSSALNLQIIVVSSQSDAVDIINQIHHGADFGALAKARSLDSTADSRGYMNNVDPAKLRPELRATLAGLQPGQVSQPVKTTLGFAVITLLGPARGTAGSTSGGTAATEAAGSVKYSVTVSGQNEAQMPLREMSEEPSFDPTQKAVCQIMSSYSQKDTLERFLEQENQKSLSSQGALNLMDAHRSLGEINAYLGNMDVAIEQYKKAQEIAQSHNPDAAQQLNEMLGIAYLHKSEMENDVYRKPGDRCLLPMQRSSRYARPEDSRTAIEYFLKFLAQKPDDLEVKWLLNLAYMTAGEYPDGVPQQYLISPSIFQSQESAPHFRDVAPEAGLDTFTMAGGVIVDDFLNDGRLDIVKSSFDTCAPMKYFRNNGDGSFTEQAAKMGLAEQLGGLNIVQTDYNNDGCLDILVMRGGWESAQHRSLLRNNCDGTFTDVTKASGLNAPTSSQAAVWVDINNDGLLDLFVGNENGPAQLFLNLGNGKFKDISHSAGVDRVSFAKGVAAADYDNDGYPDLFVSNLTGPNLLYHNNHNKTFTEVAELAGVAGPTRGFPAWFFDYDNDGWPDLFVTSYFFSVDETARTYLGLPHNAPTMKLYRNLGNGNFRDVTAEVGLDKVFMPMGANFGDIDNDGFLDIYLGTGSPTYGSLVPNVLLRNKEGKSFVDVTNATGTGDWHKGHGVAFADLTNRGVEDIVTVIGGATPGDAHAMRVFENPGSDNDWINLKLLGVKTNRAAIGARIKLTVESRGGAPRSIYRTVGSGGSFGASPLQQHVGLGKDTKILALEIWWPTSNTRQRFASVTKNQFLQIKEFSRTSVKLERKPYRLGSPDRDRALGTKSSLNAAGN
jgi:tetratricopeptide (TPR) repeat protein